MDSLIYLAGRYVIHHWFKSVILILCLTLSIFLPLAGRAVLKNLEDELQARANATPLVIGAKGSRFDLALHTLYFDVQPGETIPYSVNRFVIESEFAWAIPIYSRHVSQNRIPIVGTSLGYFEFRQLRLEEGSLFSRIGQCVIGSDVAKSSQKGVGDFLLTTPETDVNIAGINPIKMQITGVLTANGTSDDQAIFTDLKTTWIIDGLGHGHQDIEEEDNPNLFLDKTDKMATVNKGVVPYIEITDDNLGSFHFHGKLEDFPITAVICDPNNEKAATRLEGRINTLEKLQIVAPSSVIRNLMKKILQVKSLFDIATIAIFAVTTLFLVLNTLLSIRLRSREMMTMYKMGCGRFTIFGLYAWEYIIVLLASLLLALLLSMLLVGTLQQAVLEVVR
ncbi:ABC transporter permease [Mariniblastus sp.]|jgi:putative ABC transport system permease protein|nr:ABC transporter permease [Mariniblastus sp.]MDB4756575.1 ABC transporter permease [Mariniblastus sp.]